MRERSTRAFVAALAVVVLGAGAGLILATTGDSVRVQGEVTEIRQQAMDEEGAPFDEITIRTRERAGMRLRLGRAGEADPPCQVGDRVRARLMKGGAVEGAYQVRTMWNEDTGQRARFRDGSGDLLQSRDRRRARDGSCDGEPRRIRDREHRHDHGGATGSGRRGGRGGSTGRGNGR